MNQPGTLIYRCLRCGVETKSWHVPDIHLGVLKIMWGQRLPEEWGPANPQRFSTHLCQDGNLGVEELIGGEIDK